MKITECGFGHLYDTDVYTSCPYCKKNAETVPTAGVRSILGGHTVRPGDTAIQENVSEGRSITGVTKTRPPKEFGRKMGAERKTIGVVEEKLGYDPTAGWLVCVEGQEKGKNYPLFCRKNSIGADGEMDVCIKLDNTISKRNHAYISYESKKKQFYLLVGETKNNIYLNDEPVFVPTIIKEYDIIEFGNTKLLFIPLCGPKFDWETGLKQND